MTSGSFMTERRVGENRTIYTQKKDDAPFSADQKNKV